MNNVIISGNLGKDPEHYVTNNGNEENHRTVFSVAVQKGYGKDSEADFFRVVSFGKLAENCAKYLKKGRRCLVRGRLSANSYTNKDGAKVYSVDIIASEVEFGQKTGTEENAGGSSPAAETAPAGVASGEQPSEAPAAASQDEDVPEGFQLMNDEDIPF